LFVLLPPRRNKLTYSHPDQLSLVILAGVVAIIVSTSETRKHATISCTSPVQVSRLNGARLAEGNVDQHRLMLWKDSPLLLVLDHLDICRRSSTWSPSGPHQPSRTTASSHRMTSSGCGWRAGCHRSIHLGHAGRVLVNRGSLPSYLPCRMTIHYRAELATHAIAECMRIVQS